MVCCPGPITVIGEPHTRITLLRQHFVFKDPLFARYEPRSVDGGVASRVLAPLTDETNWTPTPAQLAGAAVRFVLQHNQTGICNNRCRTTRPVKSCVLTLRHDIRLGKRKGDLTSTKRVPGLNCHLKGLFCARFNVRGHRPKTDTAPGQ